MKYSVTSCTTSTHDHQQQTGQHQQHQQHPDRRTTSDTSSIIRGEHRLELARHRRGGIGDTPPDDRVGDRLEEVDQQHPERRPEHRTHQKQREVDPRPDSANSRPPCKPRAVRTNCGSSSTTATKTARANANRIRVQEPRRVQIRQRRLRHRRQHRPSANPCAAACNDLNVFPHGSVQKSTVCTAPAIRTSDRADCV